MTQLSRLSHDLRPHYEHISAKLERLDEPFAAKTALSGGMDALGKVGRYGGRDARIAQLRAAREKFAHATEEAQDQAVRDLIEDALLGRIDTVLERVDAEELDEDTAVTLDIN